MAKRKSTHNDLQTEGQTIQWPKEKVHTMIYKQKDRQYNGQKKKYKRTHNDLQTEGQTIQWPKEKGQTMIYKTLHRKLKI